MEFVYPGKRHTKKEMNMDQVMSVWGKIRQWSVSYKAAQKPSLSR